MREAKTLWVIGGIVIAVLASAGMRLAYTERARAAMYDYERRVKAARNDPSTRAEWDRMLAEIDDIRDQRISQLEDCRNLSERQRKDYERFNDDEALPLQPPYKRVYTAEQLCLANRAALEFKEIERAEKEKESLGFYDSWAVKQAGFEGQHPWNHYPRELVERLRRGERGLLLGPFWKYIL